MIGDLVVADVQIRNGGVPYQSRHEHAHQVIVDQVTLRGRINHAKFNVINGTGQGQGGGREGGSETILLWV